MTLVVKSSPCGRKWRRFENGWRRSRAKPHKGGVVGVDHGDVEGVDAGDRDRQRRSVPPPRRVFPELITEEAEPGEEVVYGAAAELVVDWREAWADRRAARHTLAWLRAERQRLELEVRLIGVFGLTPPPADAPWRERRREQELDWRRKALRRQRWQLPLTWGLHGLLRLLTLGLWGRRRSPERDNEETEQRAAVRSASASRCSRATRSIGRVAE